MKKPQKLLGQDKIGAKIYQSFSARDVIVNQI